MVRFVGDFREVIGDACDGLRLCKERLIIIKQSPRINYSQY